MLFHESRAMTRSELIDSLLARLQQYKRSDIELAVTAILEAITKALVSDDRVEIRGFGSFSTHARAARTGRNPATGQSVQVPAKRVVRFKPGVELRERVHAGMRVGVAKGPFEVSDSVDTPNAEVGRLFSGG